MIMTKAASMPGSATLIRGHAIEVVSDRLFGADSEAGDAPPDEPGWIVTLDTWLDMMGALSSRRFPVGVTISPGDDVWRLRDEHGLVAGTAMMAYIAVDFPSFTDGRGYSHAQTLRQHLHYAGELRATGDVLLDTLFYLHRCGFDSFVLKHGHDAHQASSALSSFTHVYQRGYRASSSADDADTLPMSNLPAG